MYFRLWLQKNTPREFGSTKKQTLLTGLKKLYFAELKEYTATLQWVGLKLHLLNVQFEPREISFTFTSKDMDNSAFKSFAIRHNPEFQKKLLDILVTKKRQEFRIFVHSVQQAITKIQKTQV